MGRRGPGGFNVSLIIGLMVTPYIVSKYGGMYRIKASKIRHYINENLFLCYAYYASDNPLETGSTLSSRGLGLTGVKPTYLITLRILEKILK